MYSAIVDSNKPFFATFAVLLPHEPYEVREVYLSRRNPAALQMRSHVPDITTVMVQSSGA